VKKLVIYGIGCGLGNRLLTIASGIVYAKKTNKKFEMIWHTGGTARTRQLSHCNCKFEYLFDDDFSLKDIENYNFYMKNSKTSYENFTKENYWTGRFRRKNIEYVGEDFDVEFFNVNCIFNVNPPNNLKEICVTLDSNDKITQDYVLELKNAINKLKPKQSILDRVKSLPKNTIGMHIRRTDFLESIEYSKSTRPTIADKTYDLIIEKEISDGNHVYLCSDEFEIKKDLKNKYGDKIITYDFGYKESYKNTSSKEGVTDALIEILTLKNTSKIIQTDTSSFSYLAALWGGIKLETVTEYKL
jgi:hypothetical protein